MNNLRNNFPLLTAAICLALSAIGAQAAEPLALRNIMRDLDGNMRTISDGISREDWEQVEKTAPLIADHPQPPFAEKLRIMRFMGSDMRKFKAHDSATHERALVLGKAAKARDGEAVILAFQQLQSSCQGCHREFRQPFVDHFHGTL